MLHRLSSVAAQAFRAKALLQQAALLSPLVAFADKDALAIKDPQRIADRIRSHEILSSRHQHFTDQVRMIHEEDRIPPRSKIDKVSVPFGHLHDEIEWSFAQTSQRKASITEVVLDREVAGS